MKSRMQLYAPDLQQRAGQVGVRTFAALVLFAGLALFAALALFGWFSAGAVSPQIAPSPEVIALNADRLYVADITDSIPGYQTMSDIDKVRALRLYVYGHTPTGDPLIHDQVVNLPLRDAYAILATAGGVYCGGTAMLLSRVYKAAGFNSWVYNFGGVDGPSHETTLVEVNGQVILQDAYLNFEYVDPQEKPIPFLDLISRTTNGAAPNPQAGAAKRPWLFSDSPSGSLKEFVVALGGDAVECQTMATGVRCNLNITLSSFLAMNPSIFDFLELRRWPRQFEYLMLFPLSMDSLFTDGDARAESLLAAINRKLEGLPLDKKAGASISH